MGAPQVGQRIVRVILGSTCICIVKRLCPELAKAVWSILTTISQVDVLHVQNCTMQRNTPFSSQSAHISAGAGAENCTIPRARRLCRPRVSPSAQLRNCNQSSPPSCKAIALKYDKGCE